MRAEKERTRTWSQALVSIALLAGICVMVNYLAARHFRRSDWTSAKIYSVSEKTRGILGALDKDVKITVFMIPSGRGQNDAFDFTQELLEQFKRFGAGKITVETLDVDKQREQALLLAKKYGIDGEDLRDGVVVFESGGKTKYVTKGELVEYDYRESPMGGGESQKMRAYKGEAAFASALLTVTEAAQTQVCFAKGHDEADPEKFDENGYSAFAEALKRDNYKVRTVTGVPKDCDVFVVGGPQRAWEKSDVAALEAYLAGGGKAMLLLGPSFDAKMTHWTRNGLEEFVEKWGIKLGEALVLDPEGAVSSPAEWGSDSYGEHPIVKRMAGKITVWPAPREVRASGEAQELVRSSKDGWGETNLAVFRREAPAHYDAATDVKGPVPVAAAAEKGGARLVVVGTPDVVANFRLKLDVVRDYNVDFALSAIAWLAKKSQMVAIGAKTPEHIKLQLTEAQLSSAFWLAIAGLPLLGIALGGAVWWRRRA